MLAPADSPLDPAAFALAAAEDRRQTVLNSESHAWRDITLEPWNAGRQRLFARITALDVPGGDLEDLERLRLRFDQLKAEDPSSSLTFADVVNYDLYLPAAAKVLYIAAVPQDQWFHLRAHPARLLDAIEAWAEENIRLDEIEAACDLARRILTEHRKLVPQLRVSGGPRGSGQAGN
jgi:hypothetical protein